MWFEGTDGSHLFVSVRLGREWIGRELGAVDMNYLLVELSDFGQLFNQGGEVCQLRVNLFLLLPVHSQSR
jgi:hypothetical protein